MTQTGDDHTKLLMDFERWLKVENAKLNRICVEESSGNNGENTRQSRLQVGGSGFCKYDTTESGIARCKEK